MMMVVAVIVYKTTNIITNKIYVGKDMRDDPNYIGSGFLLKKSIAKYGKDNFVKEVLQRCSDVDVLNEAEKFWIRELNSICPNGYNIAFGGTGGDVFTNHPNKERYRQNLSVACSGALNGMYGRHHTEQTKIKISEHHKSCQTIIETLHKNTRMLTGKKNAKLSESKKRYYESDEHRLKTSNSVKQYYSTLSDEQKSDFRQSKIQSFENFKKSDRYNDYVKNMSDKINLLCKNTEHIEKLSSAIKCGLKENLIFNFILKNDISIDYFVYVMSSKNNDMLLEMKKKYNALNIQFSMKSFHSHFENIDVFLDKFVQYKKEKI